MRILKQDEAIAILRDEHGKYLRICMYVDDFAVFSNSRELYNRCRDVYFGEEGFEGEEGPLDYMLGVNFDINFEEQSIKLSGTSSINKVLERYGKPQRGSKTPMLESDSDLQYAELPVAGSTEQLALRERAARYLSLVPSMLYIATTGHSFVAKRTSVKALVYFNAPRSAFAHSDTEEPEAVGDGPEQDDGGQDDSAAPTREARTVPPDELQPGPWIPAQRPSAHKNGTLVHCAQGASIPKVITGQRPKTIRVDRNALSACSDCASSKRTASTASSAAAKRTHVVCEARTFDSV